MPVRTAVFAILFGLLAGFGVWLLARELETDSTIREPQAADERPASPPAPLAVDASPDASAPRRLGTPTEPTAHVEPASARTSVDQRGTLFALRDADGSPIAGRVHAISKQPRDGDDLGVIAEAGADGVARLSLATIFLLRDSWFVFDAPGYVPAVLDSAKIEMSVENAVRLEKGGTVEVTVVAADDRTPVEHASVRVEARRDPAADDDAPSPNGPPRHLLDRLMEANGETSADGRAVVSVGTTGPVTVEARAANWNFYVEPASADLPRAAGTVRFRLLPGCRLEIHAIDDASGAPLAVPFEVRQWAEGSPDATTGGSTTNPEKTGVFDLFPGLRPGRYRLAIIADGYAEWTSETVALDRPGAKAAVEARMRRAPRRPGGTIRLTLGTPAREGTPWYADAASTRPTTPTVLLRRTSPDTTSWSGPVLRPPLGMTIDRQAIRAGETRYDPKTRVVELTDVDPARYAVAVFDQRSWTVGGLADLEVLPDAATERTVQMTPGVRVSVADLLGGAAWMKDLRLADEARVEWPLVTFRYASMTTYDASSRLAAGTVLAPVPASRVRATFTDAQGRSREVTLPAAK